MTRPKIHPGKLNLLSTFMLIKNFTDEQEALSLYSSQAPCSSPQRDTLWGIGNEKISPTGVCFHSRWHQSSSANSAACLIQLSVGDVEGDLSFSLYTLTGSYTCYTDSPWYEIGQITKWYPVGWSDIQYELITQRHNDFVRKVKSVVAVQVSVKPRCSVSSESRVKCHNSPQIGLKTIHVNPIDKLRLLLDSLAVPKLR